MKERPYLTIYRRWMKKEKQNWDLEEIKYWLSGNLCRCTGYMGQMRAIQAYLENGSDQA